MYLELLYPYTFFFKYPYTLYRTSNLVSKPNFFHLQLKLSSGNLQREETKTPSPALRGKNEVISGWSMATFIFILTEVALGSPVLKF